jgi:RHS repeat-associated protein
MLAWPGAATAGTATAGTAVVSRGSVRDGFRYTGRLWTPPSPSVRPHGSRPVPGRAVPLQSRAAVAARVAAINKARLTRDATMPRRYKRPRVSWPAGSGTAALTQRSKSGDASLAVRAGWQQAGALPVFVTVARAGEAALTSSASDGQAGGVKVAVASRKATAALAVHGIVLSLAGTGALAHAGTLTLKVDYAGFAGAYGGAYGSRLRLVELPACALRTPRAKGCRGGIAVATVNDGKGTLTGTVVMAGRAPHAFASRHAAALASAVAPGGAVVMAVESGPSGSEGAYSATPLNPAGTWTVQDGDFNYDYPISAPPSVVGQAPQVSLDYDSQSVDGETSAANTQGGWIGDGWSYSPGYIERSYEPCSQDSNAAEANWDDLCWGGYNATLSLNGHSTLLVLNGNSGSTYHLQDDNGATAQLISNGSGVSNGLWENQYWLVTTTDGTKYYFGLNHLPGGNGSDPATGSAWGVPVFCPGTSDPCYNSSAGTSSEQTLGWQWNLDYVVSPLGALTVYNYQQETNYYEMGSALGGGTLTQYVRAGFPTSIEYGWLLSDAIAGANPQAEVLFTSSQRCTGSSSTCSSYSNLTSATASDWPDVPFDEICGSTGSCTNDSPTFFTTYMLTSIQTEATTGTSSPALALADSWSLGQNFDEGTGTGVQSVLALTSILRSGDDGSSNSVAVLPMETFTSEMIDNQVPGSSYPPLDRPRLETIDTEAGAAITVSYAAPSCAQGTAGTPPTPDANYSACFPAYWSGTGSTADWFNKSLVTGVVTADLTGTQVPDQVVAYSYLGGAAWHYNESPVISSQYRTWDQFRGYAQVETTTGTAPDPVTETLDTYMRGMNGDPQADGSTTSQTVSYPGLGPNSEGAAVTDSDWLAGQVLESDTYTASGGTVDKAVTTSWPTAWTQTASQPQPGGLPALNAQMPTSTETDTMTLQASGSWDSDAVTSYYNGNDLPDAVDIDATGSTETCTSTSYASAPSGNAMMESYPDQVTTVTGAASSSACPSSSSSDLVSDTKYYYDDESGTLTSMGTLGSLASPGGLQTGEQQAVTWPSGGSETWQNTSATRYDDYGRVTSATDGDGNTTLTAYAPAYTAGATSALPEKITTTNPEGWTSSVTYDQIRGLPLTSTDVNGEVTTETYDLLGRLVSVTLPADQGTGPTYEYSYDVTGTSPPAVTTQTLEPSGLYATSTEIYDGMLQEVQEQAPTQGGQAGRTDANLYYNSDGWQTESDAAYWDDTSSPDTTLYLPNLADVPDRTLTSYDGQGRVTSQATYDGNTEVGQTTTAYPDMNQTDITPPAGGTATSTFINALGQTTASWAYDNSATPTDSSANADVTTYTYTPAGQTATVADSNGNTWTYTYNKLGEKTASTDPGTTGSYGPSGNEGQTTYSYDADGNLTATTDPDGQELSYKYDALGRKTAEYSGTTSGTLLAAWDYDTTALAGTSGDALGQLSKTISYSGSNAYTEQITGYDAAYQPTGQTTTIPATGGAPAGSYTTSEVYGSLTGVLESTTYGADGGLPAETVGYQYNTLGLLTGFGTTSTYYLDATSYDATGQDESNTFGAYGDQLIQEYAYDQTTSRLLTSATDLQTDTSGTEDTDSYTYNQAGDVTSSQDAENAGTTSATTDLQCFQYNDLQELITAWTDNGTQNPSPTTPNPGGIGACTTASPSASTIGGPAPYWDTYAYDDLGSRTTETTADTTSQAADTTANQTTQTQTYPGSGTAAAATPAAVTATETTGPGGSITTTPGYDDDGQTTSQAVTTTSPITSAIQPSSGTLCLDDTDSATTAGNKIDINTCSGDSGQKWTVTTTGEMQVLGNCLDVSSNGTANSDLVVLEPCSTSTKGEIWHAGANGTWVNPNSGKCLNDPDSSTTAGTQLIIWTCVVSANEDWATVAGTASYPLPGTTQTITYNPQGLTASVTSPVGTSSQESSYIYDADGALLVQEDPGQVIYYVDGGAEEIIYDTSTGDTSADRFYTQSADGTNIVRTSAGAVYYETTTTQGTATEAILASNDTVTRRYYDPYGNQLTTTGTWPDNRAFLGQPQDPATNLDLLGARQYDSATGAFLSLDPVLEAGDPTQMGGYTYAGDNPVSTSDSAGLYQSSAGAPGDGTQCTPANDWEAACGGNGNPPSSGGGPGGNQGCPDYQPGCPGYSPPGDQNVANPYAGLPDLNLAAIAQMNELADLNLSSLHLPNMGEVSCGPDGQICYTSPYGQDTLAGWTKDINWASGVATGLALATVEIPGVDIVTGALAVGTDALDGLTNGVNGVEALEKHRYVAFTGYSLSAGLSFTGAVIGARGVSAAAAEASSEASAQVAWGGFSRLEHNLPAGSPEVGQAAMSWFDALGTYQDALPASALWGTAATAVSASEAVAFGAEWLQNELSGN